MSVQHSPTKNLSGSAPNLSTVRETSATLMLSEDDGAENMANVTRRHKRKFCDDVSDSKAILNEMHKLFAGFESKQNSKFDSLNVSVNNILLQNQEIQKSIEFFSRQYDTLLERMDHAEEENKSLRKRISSLENKMDFLERNARSTMVEIRNIPNSVPENRGDLTGIVQSLGSVVSQPIQSSDIKDVHRIKSKNSASNPILVEFTSKYVKETFIKSVKTFNKTNRNTKLSTTQLRLPGPHRPVYVSESLTSRGRFLFYLAREFIKKENYESCWSAYGKIYIKKRSDTPTIRIESEEDFGRLKNSTL